MIDAFEVRNVRADLRVTAKRIEEDFGEAAAAKLLREAERLLAQIGTLDQGLHDPSVF